MDNNCKQIEPMISEYIDGVLSSDQTWRVRMHVASCHSCARLLEELQKTIAVIQTASVPALSNAFDRVLQDRIASIATAKQQADSGSILAKVRYAWSAGMAHLTRGQQMRIAISTPILAATLAVAFVVMAPHPGSQTTTAVDNSFVATCVTDHQNFVASQPLADPSAQALAQHIESHTGSAAEGVNALDADGSL